MDPQFWIANGKVWAYASEDLQMDSIDVAKVYLPPTSGKPDSELNTARTKLLDKAIHRANTQPALLEALEALFEHCAMVHKHWGEGSNLKEANAAIEAGRAAIKAAKEAS